MMHAPIIPITVAAAPLLIWALFRRGGYKRHLLDQPPGPNFEPTGERFIDPSTNAPATVYFDPKTGERAYVRTPASGSN